MHFLTKDYFLTAERNLTTWGPLYTCLVQHLYLDLKDFSSNKQNELQDNNCHCKHTFICDVSVVVARLLVLLVGASVV